MTASLKRRLSLCIVLTPAVLAVFAILLFLYGNLIESKRIQVTHHTYASPMLPQALGGFTIVHMADFHRGSWVSDQFIQHAVELANAQEPDLIVLTGDYAGNGSRYLESCTAALTQLKAPQGVFATLGNHDHHLGARHVERELEQSGITVLTNKHALIAEGIWLIGIDDWGNGWPDADGAYRGVPRGGLEIVATHSPRLIHQVEHRNALVLTSHTHGGQINIPGLPVHRLPRYKNFPWTAGWYRVGQADMFVTRGIGTVGPPARIRARPEIAVIVLKAD